ncbi:hypothetical protein AB0I84_13160 [Streptomyces spectabilis]|uniref:hypothetical protein n=1 Tax=Streptomyces spectabilis TaxID=68270 RepID=UPI0033DD5C80
MYARRSWPGLWCLADAAIAVADAEQTDLQTECAKLIRWHREDGDALTEMRATIERLREEKRELGELAALRESELIARRARVAELEQQAAAVQPTADRADRPDPTPPRSST